MKQRKILLCVAVTLDGFIEGPNGEYDWCFTDQDYGMKEFLSRIDTVFYGRKSYDSMLMAGNGEDQSSRRNPFASFTSFVFSNTLTESYPNTHLVSGNTLEHVQQLKTQEGKDIWLFGGAGLLTTLLKAGLVDELHLAVHPLLLGSGKSLFQQLTGRMQLKFVDSKAYSTGLVMLRYEIDQD